MRPQASSFFLQDRIVLNKQFGPVGPASKPAFGLRCRGNLLVCNR